MSSHHQITDIFEGRSFRSGVDYGEYFSCFISEVSEWTEKALASLKKNAQGIIPKSEWKNIIYDSADFYGRRTFMWRHGREWWINLHEGHEPVTNVQTYEVN